MSYILEALKKSDQLRQRGTTPTLPITQVTATAPKPLFSVYYGLSAAVLICTGMVIGWLRPWQAEPPANTAEPIAARPAISNPIAPIPLSVPPETARNMEQKFLAPNATQVVSAAPRTDATQTSAVPAISTAMTGTSADISALAQKKPVPPVAATQEAKAIPLAELPLTIQQELPTLTIQLHSYSSKPANSLVSINSRLMKEGESLTPELRLEQITPDGVVFSYKGYRFQHGIW